MTHYVENPERESASDEEGFQRFRRGDRRGMDFVFERYYPKLVFYADKYLHNLDDAEDVCLIALERAWDRHRTYRSFRHLNNALYLITRNECFDLLRDQGREDEKVLALMQLQSDDFEVNKAVDRDRVLTETLARVWREIDRHFDKQTADMLRLHFNAGWSDARIAEAYQIKEGNVRVNRSRALDKLRKLFGKNRFYPILMLLLTNKFR